MERRDKKKLKLNENKTMSLFGNVDEELTSNCQCQVFITFTDVHMARIYFTGFSHF